MITFKRNPQQADFIPCSVWLYNPPEPEHGMTWSSSFAPAAIGELSLFPYTPSAATLTLSLSASSDYHFILWFISGCCISLIFVFACGVLCYACLTARSDDYLIIFLRILFTVYYIFNILWNACTYLIITDCKIHTRRQSNCDALRVDKLKGGK